MTAVRLPDRSRLRTLAGRTSWSMVIEALTLVQAMSTFLVLGRSLGPTDYGRYSATVSLFAVVGAFAVGGAGHLAAKRVALGASPATVWPATAGMVHVGGLVGVAVSTVVAGWLLPGVPLMVVLGLAVAELVVFRLVPNAVLLSNGLDRPDVGAGLMSLMLAARLSALGVFFVVDSADLGTWVVLNLASGALAVGLIHALARRVFSSRELTSRPTVEEYRQGFPFALALAPNSLMNDADKTLLTTLGRPTDGGLYAAGYRIAAMAYMPIMAVIRATYSHFFRQGAKGMGASLRTARRLTVVTGGVGLCAAVGLVAVAPLLPVLLGDDFQESVQVVQVMAALPLLKGLQYPAANALTGADRQYLRVALLMGVALLNIGLNLALIPSFGWQGAAAATYVAEGVFIAGLWASLLHLSRSEGRQVVA